MTAPRPKGPRVFTIPPGVNFAADLARGIIRRHGDDGLSPGRVRLLLPNRRSIDAVSAAFLAEQQRGAAILPHMQPIGDTEEDELALFEGLIEGRLQQDIAPPIADMRRLLLLARLVREGARNLSEDGEMNDTMAIGLARELCRLIDQVHTQELDFSRLADLADQDHSAHWQRVLEFLRIVSEGWPAVLAADGAIEAAERRNRLVDRQIAQWKERPPAGPVIAAGSTGSVPATARLLGAIARLPEGSVVLPGLDCAMPDDDWQAVDETHPQYTMKRLLECISVNRHEVRPWNGENSATPARRLLVHEVMRPAGTASQWAEAAPFDARDAAHITRIDAASPTGEAQAIALILRHALEKPHQTAALVTPDRNLARHVAASLHRWGLEIDDSAGTPLAQTPVGRFLRLIVEAVREQLAPYPLLSLLKHPLCRCGKSAGNVRRLVRRLEISALRGPRPAAAGGDAGDALRHRIMAMPDDHKDDLIAFVDDFLDRLSPLMDVMAQPHATLHDLVDAHIRVAESLGAGEGNAPASPWQGDDGEAAAGFIADVLAAADCVPQTDCASYGQLVDGLMAGRVVRPRFGTHPRLHIWGPLEARLQSPDILVLGGLNEGVWPATPAPDPWMSRAMRRDFGLPAAEQRIGLAAHDFATALYGRRIFLTRSIKQDGGPTVKSRWLARLDTLFPALRSAAGPWLEWSRQMDVCAHPAPALPPAPRPPASVRRRDFSITDIETLMHDPYALYARHILKLRPLDDIDAVAGAAERGSLIHDLMRRFVDSCMDDLPDDAEARFLSMAHDTLFRQAATPALWANWWPRLQRLAAWYIDQEVRQRDRAKPVALEVSGEISLDVGGTPCRLYGRSDRIDRLTEGGLLIIDYKTGSLPSGKAVKLGEAPQLALEAMIAEAGGFDGLAAAPIGGLAYWQLSGLEPAGTLVEFNSEKSETLCRQAQDGLKALIACFADETTPYLSQPKPAFPGYGDYDHLARRREWPEDGGAS